jgi:hypothetical protein
MSRHIAIVGARRRTDRETVERIIDALPSDAVIIIGPTARMRGRRRLHARTALPPRFSGPISMMSTSYARCCETYARKATAC